MADELSKEAEEELFEELGRKERLAAQRRPETGPMRFGGDWTGVFFRGDNAAYFGMTLKTFLENSSAANPIEAAILRGLADTLLGCNEHEGVKDVQQLVPWEEAVK